MRKPWKLSDTFFTTGDKTYIDPTVVKETLEWCASIPPWLKRKEDYIDVEDHGVSDVKELTNGMDEDIPKSSH
jgi:hypothetical protein